MNNNEILAKNVRPGQQALLAGYWLTVTTVYIDGYDVVLVVKDGYESTEYFFGLAATVQVRD